MCKQSKIIFEVASKLHRSVKGRRLHRVTSRIYNVLRSLGSILVEAIRSFASTFIHEVYSNNIFSLVVFGLVDVSVLSDLEDLMSDFRWSMPLLYSNHFYVSFRLVFSQMFFHNFERISLFPQVTKYSARNFFFIYSVQELDFVILVVLVLFIFGLWFEFWFTGLKLDILSYFTSLISFRVNDWHHESRSLIVPPLIKQNCISHTRKLEPIVNILVDSLSHID